MSSTLATALMRWTRCIVQADDLKDRLLRTLADMENLRERTARTTAEAKQFAVQVGGWLQG